MKSKNNIAIGCIIQARMSSTRLPGKVMLKVDNENTILDCVINQLQNSKEIKNIVIATTDQKEDDVRLLGGREGDERREEGKEGEREDSHGVMFWSTATRRSSVASS